MTDRELLENMSRQIGELVRHVAEVRSSNKRLEEEISDLRADMTAMRKDIDAMKVDIDAMKVDIDTMKGDIDAMKADIDTMKSDIDHMKLDIATMKLDIENLKDDVRSLTSKVDELDQRLDGRTTLLSSKIEHFSGFLYSEMGRYRTALEEERHHRQYFEKQVENRFLKIEERLDALEKARPVSSR